MKKKFENFGIVVREFRTQTGLSQAKLGEMIGASSQTVSNVERGLAAYPERVSKAFVTKLKLDDLDTERILRAVLADSANQKRTEWSRKLKRK